MTRTKAELDRLRRAGAEKPGSSQFDLPGFAAGMGPFLDAGSKFMDNWRALGQHMVEFGETQLTRNLEAARKVASASNFDEAIEIQAAHARGVWEDCIAECGRLADLGTRAWFSGFASEAIPAKPGRRAPPQAEPAAAGGRSAEPAVTK